MKIVILNGSPRKNGATAKVLHAIEKELTAKGDVDIRFVNISDMEIKPCTGCISCYKTGSCVIKDEAEDLSKEIGAADGIIIGSPTYASNISGQLKVFIDRGHFVIEQLLHGKYGAIVTTGLNYGNKDAYKVLDKLIRYSGAQVNGKIVCNVPFGSDPLDEAMKRKTANVASAMYSDIKNKRDHIVQKIVHKIIFGFGIRPFVRKQGDAYKGVTDKWSGMGINI